MHVVSGPLAVGGTMRPWSSREPMYPRRGWLVMDSWAGRSEQLIEVVRATPTRFVIRAIDRTRLAGRDRWLECGDEAKVPQRAVRFGERREGR